MAPPLLKQSLSVVHKIESVYTGGKVEISKDGRYIFCTCGEAVKILEATSGKVLHSLKQDDDEVTCFSVSQDDQIVVIAYRSLLIRQWDWKEETCVRTWKAIHTAPIVSMAFDATSTLLATGSGDHTIKIWDIVQQYCTHNLKGSHSVVSYLKFHPNIEKLLLFSCAGSFIYVWDLQNSKLKVGLETHYGTVTSLDFSSDGHRMVSGGRDKVLVIWNVETTEPINTIPVMEVVESAFWIPPDCQERLGFSCNNPVVMIGGSLGYLRGIDSVNGQVVYQQTTVATTIPVRGENGELTSVITCAELCPAIGQIMLVTYDHHILFYNVDGGDLHKQFVGFNDEVLDVKFAGSDDSHLVVATNSEYVKVYDISTLNCQILRGHTDIVLSVDVFNDKKTMASSSKDNTVRLWKMNTEQKFECIGVAFGHTHSVGAIALSRLSGNFIVSGSEDCTVKVWNIPENLKPSNSPQHLAVNFTHRAHEKDINSVAVAPNDKLLVTASLDKTAKLWNLENHTFLGTFRGHKRSIWCVQFSPADQVVATSSADGTIKIWSITDFSCVKTFQGHDTSVLRVAFLTRGMQLLSSGSDGLLKIWSIKDNECLTTYDEHSDKLWALTVNSSEDTVATGGADSVIAFWKDVTEREWEENQSKEEDQVIKLQQLSNMIIGKNFKKAIGLALTLEQPFRLLNILKGMLNESDGKACLANIIAKLRLDQIDALLKFAVQWNTNSKHCHVAQAVVNTVLSQFSQAQLLECVNITESLEGLLPYTQRHFSRMNRLMEQSMFVEYTWHRLRTVTAPSIQNADEKREINAEESYYIDAEQFSLRNKISVPSTSTQVQDIPSTSVKPIQGISENIIEKENVAETTIEKVTPSETEIPVQKRSASETDIKDKSQKKLKKSNRLSQTNGKYLSTKDSNPEVKNNHNNNRLEETSPVDFEWDEMTHNWSDRDNEMDTTDKELVKKKSRKSLQTLVKKMKEDQKQNKEKLRKSQGKKQRKSATN
ncbi:transducin beta-like protein 3 [Antedon mediterranea]|uniref:transducin beta-like protein 3 n=1 Tax=Antedon mediterranea TaxID=105859 RepID=UPI003AF7120C